MARKRAAEQVSRPLERVTGCRPALRSAPNGRLAIYAMGMRNGKKGQASN